MTEFMGIITDHLKKIDGINPLWIKRVANELEQIAKDRPDLVERYEKAIDLRHAGEIESIWRHCSKLIGTSIRINGASGRLHVGYSQLSVLLFPKPN
jgi:hypothetical protein